MTVSMAALAPRVSVGALHGHVEAAPFLHSETGGERVDASGGVQDPDADLLHAIAGGDAGALTALYERHGTALFGFLRRMTGDDTAAEELVQDTLLGIWRGAAGFEGRSSVRTWLYVIARRLAYRRMGRRVLQVVELDAAGPLVDPAPTPEVTALANAERDEIVGLLHELSLVQREALVLFFIDDLSHAEMAEVLGVPLGTVKSRLSNARRALAALVEQRQGAGDE
jgi:RNA polymerase sigma-70 factor (ECF subfamily)